MTNTKNDKNYRLALNAAKEHRTEAAHQGANHARCIQLRDDIRSWVGRWDWRPDEGKSVMVLPDEIERIMWEGV